MSSSQAAFPGERLSDAAIIALGSNLGDSKQILHQALVRLSEMSRFQLLSSGVYKSEPVDCPPGSPPFLNAVTALVPAEGETPESLLSTLQRLEEEFGRPPKKVMNEPRPLDLDLIAFGQERRNTSLLKLPHPRAHRRSFVLLPLSEIAPDLVLPGQTSTAMELLGSLPRQDLPVKVADGRFSR
jgi:2-amino-4-hydroxy-6-hydroxymethyldihydropteridine diphosphokinase